MPVEGASVFPLSLNEKLEEILLRVGDPLRITRLKDEIGLSTGPDALASPSPDVKILGFVPAISLQQLGDRSFQTTHGSRYACMAGAMANGIASVELVEAMAHGGMLAIFGSAGLSLGAVERAINRLQSQLRRDEPYGCNLIHSPQDPHLETAIVDLLLTKRVELVEASAFLDLTLPVVRYRVAGIHRDDSGRVVTPNRIIAKVSRVEVATKFLSPPPEKLLRELVHSGKLSNDQAEMARTVPMAEDLTAEADSGGHTDNQPAIVLLPTMITLRDRLIRQHRYDRRVRVGAAGGISTPWAASAALAMGAAYLVTGSVNQSCIEAGTSETVRKMLCQAQQADIAMAPAADMFEMGVKVQVLKRGTMFAMRAAKLYDYYKNYDAIEEIPEGDRTNLERNFFKDSLESIWEQTREYFASRDPGQIERASRDPKHKMALAFRWYLGQSSNWANRGVPDRTIDYQIWCGPAMAAFNSWTQGTFLERPEERRVVTVAMNILFGAAVLERCRSAALQGFPLPPGRPCMAPLQPDEIENRARCT